MPPGSERHYFSRLAQPKNAIVESAGRMVCAWGQSDSDDLTIADPSFNMGVDTTIRHG
ncbi:MAG: hypothetical protein ACJA14_001098 [Ilumatobacter sp.]